MTSNKQPDISHYSKLRQLRPVSDGMRYSKVLEMFKTCKERVEAIEAIVSLELPDCWAAAGVVRNTIWDVLHGTTSWTPLADIDVAYHDATACDIERDTDLESRLCSLCGGFRFSVKNQARMHSRNGHSPYRCSRNALLHWTETCTAVGITISEGNWRVLAPWGVDDLLNLVVRPTFQTREYIDKVLARVAEKKWLTLWPKLTIETLGATSNII